LRGFSGDEVVTYNRASLKRVPPRPNRIARMSSPRKFRLIKRAIPLVLAALLAPAVAAAFTPFVVKDIQVKGIERVDPGTIFTYLPVKVGQTFTQEEASVAIQKLYGTGFFQRRQDRRAGRRAGRHRRRAAHDRLDQFQRHA
jgi:hypothetical protein